LSDDDEMTDFKNEMDDKINFNQEINIKRKRGKVNDEIKDANKNKMVKTFFLIII
jgi:hypothetical protein